MQRSLRAHAAATGGPPTRCSKTWWPAPYTLTLTLPLTLTLTLVPTPTLALNPNQVAGGVPPTAVSLNAAIFAAAVGGEWRRALALL